jgi:hypothetical protein
MHANLNIRGYNRSVKAFGVLLTALLLSGCNRHIENKEAVRQAVVDYLSARKNLNVASMNVDVTSVSFKKDEAEAVVAFTSKGAGGPGMTMRYTLERKGSRWVVKNRPDQGSNPHGGAMPAPPSELPPGHPSVSGSEKKE